MSDMPPRDMEMEKQVREAFALVLDEQDHAGYHDVMQAKWLETPVGAMLAVADTKSLHLLSFLELSGMERRVALMQQRIGACMEIGKNQPIESISDEMADYFAGKLREFTTPTAMDGTVFQIQVWEELRRVPYGHTISYAELAEKIGKPSAFRAVAQANAQNPLHILVPCHRIINTDGASGGNAAGTQRKKWLIEFEQSVLAKDGK